MRYIILSKKHRFKSNLGWIVGSIGVGVVITFIIPFWGWIIACGCGLIYTGWYLIEHANH